MDGRDFYEVVPELRSETLAQPPPTRTLGVTRDFPDPNRDVEARPGEDTFAEFFEADAEAMKLDPLSALKLLELGMLCNPLVLSKLLRATNAYAATAMTPEERRTKLAEVLNPIVGEFEASLPRVQGGAQQLIHARWWSPTRTGR
jgi:hypothetical protein